MLSLGAGLLFVTIGGAQLLGGASVLDWLVVLRAWPLLLVVRASLCWSACGAARTTAESLRCDGTPCAAR